MGKWVHRLSEIDEEQRTAICQECGPVTIRKRNNRTWRCNKSDRKDPTRSNRRYIYRRHVGDVCEDCGFVPESTVQLDVHHIDGNHKNSARSNLRTLCANCHRLYTLGIR